MIKRSFILAATLAAFLAQAMSVSARASFLQVDPVGFADNMNLYAYVNNDPFNGIDPSGTVCIFAPGGNGSGAFCQRSLRFAALANDPAISSRTSFFAAASMTTNVLASKDFFISGVSSQTSAFLDSLSGSLEVANLGVADAIRSGHAFSGGSRAQNDAAFVRFEQGLVQAELDSLDSDTRASVVGEINSLLNGDTAASRLGNALGADRNFQSVLSQVREQVGGDIDFGNIDHRIAIGDALTA
ncbi:MAG: hypothetical protein Tsb0010_04390 [Parvularculaceae bacterium]